MVKLFFINKFCEYRFSREPAITYRDKYFITIILFYHGVDIPIDFRLYIL
jgi:hypothetical protein